MNYLDEWYNQIRMLKWTLVLHGHPYINQLDAIYHELADFFPPSDFDATIAPNPHNWLLHLFADKQPNSIYLLNETAEMIRYFRQLGSPLNLQFYTKNGNIDYRSLQDRLFELQVHYLLADAGFQPKLGCYYTMSNGVMKPMDMTIEAGGQIYNIEATKYYDGFKEQLLNLGTRILSKIASDSAKGKYYLDELFCGYLLYKKKNEALLRSGYQVFTLGLQSFIKGYRSAKANTILLPGKKTTDDYEFYIEPGFADQYTKNYDALAEGYPAFIKFRISANMKDYRSHIDLRITAAETKEDRNKRLIAKIHEKRQQHRQSPYPLLIVIAIEQVFSSHPKNRTQAITSQDVDEKAIHEEIRGKCTVLLLFKHLKRDGVTYDRVILGDLNGHAALIEKLKSINPVIYYRDRHLSS